jgi:hypothetical protein
MSFALGARTGFSFIEEAVYGVTPTSPAMQDLPITGHRLTLEKQSVSGAVIRPDRMGVQLHHGQRSVTGSIEAEFCTDAFDALLEAAMMSEFDGDVLEIGSMMRSFTFEDRMTDIALYRKFTGCVVDKMTCRVQPNSQVALSFGIAGRDQTADMATPLNASYAAMSGNEPFDAYRIVLSEGGDVIAKVSALNFTLDNQIDPAFVIGAQAAPRMLAGGAKISGEMTAYVDNGALLNKFLNETDSAIEMQCDDGTTQYTILLPRVKYTGGNLSLENDQARLLTLPFEALFDAGTGTMMRMTKMTI